MTDASGNTLADGVSVDTTQINVYWAVANGTNTTTLTMNGVPQSFDSLGGGVYHFSTDTSAVTEESFTFEITARALHGKIWKVIRAIRVDRVAPALIIKSPTDCEVDALDSGLSVIGTVKDSDLESVTITEFDDTYPQGHALRVKLRNGNFTAEELETVGDRHFEIVATDSTGHSSEKSVREAYFPAGSLVPFGVTAQTQDALPVTGTLNVGGQSFSIPGTALFPGTGKAYFKVAGLDQFITISAALNPADRYIFDATTGTLSPTPDGCVRTLEIVTANPNPAFTVTLVTTDSSGSPIPGVTYELNGKALSGSTFNFTAGLSFDVTVDYGVSQVAAQILGGVHTGETVTYALDTGVLQRAATPGQTEVKFVGTPGNVHLENFSSAGMALNPPGEIKSAFLNTPVSLYSEYDGFSHSSRMTLEPDVDYAINVFGDRVFARPASNLLVDSVGFYYQLVPVTFAAVTSTGIPVAASFNTPQAQTPISANFPTQVSLGLGSSGAVQVSLNGFNKISKVRVLQDESVHVNLATSEETRTYSFQKPGLEWILNPVDVELEIVDAQGNLAPGTVGIVGTNAPQGASPQVVSLAERTRGSVFAIVQGTTYTAATEIHPGTLQTVSESTGAITEALDPSGKTIVRFAP